MTNNATPYTKGFTLIETLVAVLLLSVAVAGPLTIVSRASSSATVAKDQVIAYYLAQEAIEYIRFTRDTNCLNAGSSAPCPSGTNLGGPPWLWLSKLQTCATGTCKIDANANSVASCTPSSATDCLLYYNDTSKFYGHTSTGATATRFKRYATIGVTSTGAAASNEALVTVTVEWQSAFGASTRSVVLQEYIYNWQ